MTGVRSTRRWASTRTACCCPGSRSPLVRSATVFRWLSAPRWGCARSAAVPGSSCWSATRSWTKAATTRRWSWPPRSDLDGLTVVVIDNHSSSYAVRGRIERRFRTEGWHAVTADGRDHDALEAALSYRDTTRPHRRRRHHRGEVMTTALTHGHARAVRQHDAVDLVDADPRVALVYAEISGQYLGGVTRRHPDRVINVGIREQLLVSTGAGLALSGLKPIVHTFGSFLVERPFEQIKLDFVHQGVDGVLVGSGGSFDIAAGGRTHQSPGDVALLATLPESPSTYPAPRPRWTRPSGHRSRPAGCTTSGWSSRPTAVPSRTSPAGSTPSAASPAHPWWWPSGPSSTPCSPPPRTGPSRCCTRTRSARSTIAGWPPSRTRARSSSWSPTWPGRPPTR